MGLLDDAIREHLDLKRRRGADQADVERAEREALGPVRREPFDSAGDELEPSAAAYDREEELYDERPIADSTFSDERDWDNVFEEEPEALQGAGEPGDSPGVTDAAFRDEFAMDEDVSPQTSAGPLGDETMAYDIGEATGGEEAEPRRGRGDAFPHEDDALPTEEELEAKDGLRAQPGPEKQHGEEVLEETPEFLDDTPEGDRLRFEQRSPRDFGFDD